MKRIPEWLWASLALAAGVVLTVLGLAGAFHFGDYVPHIGSLCCAGVGLATIISVAIRTTGQGARSGPRLARIGRTLARIAPPAMVVLATCGVYWYLVLGQMPWNGDHPLHLFKAWHLGEKLLASGRLTGWSHFWWTGYPAESLYPFLADLLVVLVRALSFGLAPWPVAYAWALLITLILYHLGIWAVGARWFGPWTGTAAAFLAVIDRGGPRESGWFWTMANGVWPMALGTALWFFALERFIAILDKPTRGRLVAMALLQTLAVLGHPMTLMFSLLVYPLLWLVHLLRASKGRLVIPIWVTVCGLGLAVLLASFWYVPFFTSSEYVEKVGGTWWTMVELGERMKSVDLFEGTWRGIEIFGLAGIILAWSMRHKRGRDLTIVLGIMIIAISSTTLSSLDLSEVHEGFNVIHFRRFTYPIKLLWFLLAGFALTGVGGLVADKLASRAPDRPPGVLRAWAFRALALVVLIPLLESFAVAFYLAPLSDIGQHWPLEDAAKDKAFKESNTWFSKNLDDSDPFFRIAYEVGGSGHLFYSTPVFIDRPAVVISQYTSGASFNRIFRNNSPATFRYQQVRYVVALTDFLEKRKDLEQVHKTDHIYIYEVEGYDPDPFTVDGEAKVELLEFSDERIRLKVTDATKGETLILHVTELDRWGATLAGKPVEISSVQGNKHAKWLMSVPIDRDGELVFTYSRGLPEWLGIFLTLLGLATVVLILVSGRVLVSLPILLKIRHLIHPIVHRVAGPALGVCAVMGIAVVVAFLTSGKEPPGSYRFSDHFDEMSVEAYKKKGETIECEQIFDRRIRCQNGEKRFIYKGAKRSGSRHESKLLSGILMRPFTKYETVLTFPKVKMKKSMIIRCGTDYLGKGKGTVGIKVLRGEKIIGKIGCPTNGNWKQETVDTTKYKGKTIDLKIEVKRSSSAPKIVLDGWIVD